MEKINKNGFMAKKYNYLLAASLFGWIISLVGSLSDSVLAGVLISEEAVGAVTLITPVNNLLFFFSTLLGVGVSTLFSVYLGAFEEEKAAKINGMGIICAFASGVILVALMVIFKDAYFAFFNGSEAINTLAKEYYSCFYILAFTYPLYWMINYLVSADGDEKNVLLCSIATAVCNPLFSIVLAGQLGIRGLAYGTVLANIVSIIFLARHFFKKGNAIKFKLHFSFKEFGKVFSVGSSASLGQIYLAVVDIIMKKSIMMSFGEEYLAAYAVINLILNFGACFSCSMDAASPFVTIAYGEKNTVIQRRVMKLTSKTALILGIAFTVVEFAIAGFLPNLFGISNPEVYSSAVSSGRLLAFMNLGLTFEAVLATYYPKVNQSILGNLYTIMYSLITPLIFAIPLANAFGFIGLACGFFLTPYATLLIGFIYVAIKYGKKMYPYIIPESEDKIFVYELEVNDKQIIELNNEVKSDLKSCNVEQSIITELQLMLEETFMIVHEKNAPQTVLADCSVIVGDDKVRLITRDNGHIFNITEVDEGINSFRHYVAARLIERNSGAEYMTTISFNRNSYLWEKTS